MRGHTLARGILAAALLVASAESAQALPRFSLLAGTRCVACHVTPQGGGLRTDMGWMAMNQVGAISFENNGLFGAYNAESNSLFDGAVTFGFDARLQVAKLGVGESARRKVIPMQLAPAAAWKPLDELTVMGTYNAGPLRYPGQTSYEAALQWQPSHELPSLRVGHIQPSIGLRHDDHTLFVRRDAVNRGTIIAPNYAELGGEVAWDGLEIVSATAGAFSARNIAQADPSIDSNGAMVLGRLMLWPQLLEEGINGILGVSYYGDTKGAFSMVNAFVGLGLSDKATIIGEGMYRKNEAGQITRNLSLMSSYQLATWLALDWRYEWGLSEHPSTGPYYAHAFVIGTEFFPIPFVELRPEYRYYADENRQDGQYTIQLHLFY